MKSCGVEEEIIQNCPTLEELFEEMKIDMKEEVSISVDEIDKDSDINSMEDGEAVLLFEVFFKQEDGEFVKAILKLEDLKFWSPSLLLEFLQARLEVAGEEVLERDEVLVGEEVLERDEELVGEE